MSAAAPELPESRGQSEAERAPAAIKRPLQGRPQVVMLPCQPRQPQRLLRSQQGWRGLLGG